MFTDLSDNADEYICLCVVRIYVHACVHRGGGARARLIVFARVQALVFESLWQLAFFVVIWMRPWRHVNFSAEIHNFRSGGCTLFTLSTKSLSPGCNSSTALMSVIFVIFVFEVWFQPSVV